jgi:hypothetical protein
LGLLYRQQAVLVVSMALPLVVMLAQAVQQQAEI